MTAFRAVIRQDGKGLGYGRVEYTVNRDVESGRLQITGSMDLVRIVKGHDIGSVRSKPASIAMPTTSKT